MAITLNNTDINGALYFSGTNVGIGISNPGNKLNVVDSTSCVVESKSTNGFASFRTVASGVNASYMFFNNAGGEKGRISSYDGGELTFSNGTSATERMRISANGDLQVASAPLPAPAGNAPLYLCRAWVNFNGVGTVTIRGSGNVSSVSDNGQGDFSINFTTAMPDAIFSTIGMAAATSDGNQGTLRGISLWGPTSYATTYVRIRTMNGINTAAYDTNTVCVAVFR